MAPPGLLKRYAPILYRAILSILAPAMALAEKARAQTVQPKYGVLNISATLYGPPMPINATPPAPSFPANVLYGPPPAPVNAQPTPLPDLSNTAPSPLAIIAIAASILILAWCAWVGLTWLLRRGKDRK